MQNQKSIEPHALLQLLAALDIPPGSDTIAQTQKHWLRKPGQERWELSELTCEHRFAAWKPSLNSYDTALILGATTAHMKRRLHYLKELWLQGIRFDEIGWLTGERPLDSRVDDLLDCCSSESEAAHILWKEADLPQEMRKLPIHFVVAPMKRKEATLTRPNTEDTILAWLEMVSQPCRVLFVSDQPFCGYQFAVVKTCLPDFLQFELVGQDFDPTSHPTAAALTLDSIARWIYQENLYSRRR